MFTTFSQTLSKLYLLALSSLTGWQGPEVREHGTTHGGRINNYIEEIAPPLPRPYFLDELI
jgi:hypothetical protein